MPGGPGFAVEWTQILRGADLAACGLRSSVFVYRSEYLNVAEPRGLRKFPVGSDTSGYLEYTSDGPRVHVHVLIRMSLKANWKLGFKKSSHGSYAAVQKK